MARLKITTDQDFLRKISKPVTSFDSHLHRVVDDMRDTLSYVNGLGLAAVQIGVLYRVCLVNDRGEVVELVNPEIIRQSSPKIDEEACLSIPNEFYMIERPSRVLVRAYDRYGKKFEREFKGLSSICAAHEIDHLNGIIISDKESRAAR